MEYETDVASDEWTGTLNAKTEKEEYHPKNLPTHFSVEQRGEFDEGFPDEMEVLHSLRLYVENEQGQMTYTFSHPVHGPDTASRSDDPSDDYTFMKTMDVMMDVFDLNEYIDTQEWVGPPQHVSLDEVLQDRLEYEDGEHGAWERTYHTGRQSGEGRPQAHLSVSKEEGTYHLKGWVKTNPDTATVEDIIEAETGIDIPEYFHKDEAME